MSATTSQNLQPKAGWAEDLSLICSKRVAGDGGVGLSGDGVFFSMDEPGQMDAVRPYFSGGDRSKQLPRNNSTTYSRESGKDLEGKLF